MNEENCPPEIRALHAAYVAATGIEVVLNYDRRWALREISRRGNPPFGPDDVRGVLQAIRRKIDRGDVGCTEASILFHNAMKPNVFEERALLLRQQIARRKGAKPKAQVPRVDAAGVTRLDDPPLTEAKRADVVKALNGLASEIARTGGK